MIVEIVLLFFGTIVAFWISAICGGGASLILIPILNLLLPASNVPFSLTIGTFTSSASRIAVFKKHINWKIFLWFVPFSIPAVLLGAWLIKFVNPNYLQMIVAVFLIANIPQLFKSRKEEKTDIKPYPNFVLALIGFFAGFISGITGAIGLLFNRFYLRFGLSKEEIVATRAANEVFLHLIKLIIYITLGLYSGTALWLGLTMAAGTIVSSYTVKFILPYLSEFTFKKVGYIAMVISGIILFTSTSEKIILENKVSFSVTSDHHKTESQITWRKSNLSIEYNRHKGLELEKHVPSHELPENIRNKYEELNQKYDRVSVEKVFSFTKKVSYEFYCYIDDEMIQLKD
ncbi:sulfite exporter TauE/SafE family protein [Chryseobacterium sp.]|uniref:sulfite exporter TauE/SafE family protein n=1 Tax=Chryseobacterium sp. TaxID=1871047 RepID=UPI0025C1FDB8|nr:sulfite exporter TauE/SafE family protein [Chryseobacterium sp.]